MERPPQTVKPIRWYQSIRFRVLQFMLILLVLMTLAIDLVVDTYSYDHAYQQELEQVQLRTALVINELKSQFKAVEATSVSLSQMVSLHGDYQQMIDEFTSGLTNNQLFAMDAISGGGIWPDPSSQLPDASPIGWELSQGHSHLLSGSERQQVHASLLAHRGADTGGSCWSAIDDPLSHMDHSHHLVCCTPYQRGEESGMISVELNLNWIQQRVQTLSEELGGKILLFDRTQGFLADASIPANPSQALLQQIQPLLVPLEPLPGSDQPVAQSEAIVRPMLMQRLEPSEQSDALLLHAYTMPRLQWTVVTLVPESPLKAAVASENTTVLLLLLTGMLLSLGFGYLQLDHSVLAPLTRLRRQLNQLNAAEPLNDPLQIERDDEVGRLVEAFNLRSENLVEARKAAEHAAIGQQNFLANMSHELRTPMNGIIGATELLGDQTLAPESREYVDMIRGSTQSMLVVLNDILDLSKIESGQMQVESIRFNMCELLEQLCNMIRPSLNRELKVQLKLNCEQLAHHEYYGDPMRLQQILLNLLNNAVKFTEQGSIEVRASTQGSDDNVEHLLLEVEDSGIGIPIQRLDDIFERFTQAEYSTSRRFGGTGLGLAISKRLADLMGAELQVQSEVNQGTCFSLRLSLETAAVSDTRPPVQVSEQLLSHLAGKQVLLVEDNRVNQVIARRMLEQLGLVVTTADNGRQALEKARGQVFDLVLMDVLMPVMNGLDATRALRQDTSPNQQTPVIALTANVMEQDIHACFESGMQGYVSKPVSRRSMEEEIAWVLGLVRRQEEHSNITPLRPADSAGKD